MPDAVKQVIAETFLELSDALTTGKMGKNPKIILSGMSSEHGEKELLSAAQTTQGSGLEVIYIGAESAQGIRCIAADSAEKAAALMEELLDSGEADGAVTMHYPFPIGVATIGRVTTPAKGIPVYLASTTGTSSTDRVEGMIKNAVAGIIAAKACGTHDPTVGIANLDGARQVEIELKKLAKQGYPIRFASSERADGGCILRGNDILTGAADVIVTDTLTGNILIKMLSAFHTGGSYESVGWGYGPGIGEDYQRLVLILSRASGAPVIAGALAYAAQLVKGNWRTVAKEEFTLAKQAGLDALLQERKETAPSALESKVSAPPKEVVTGEISGVDVMDIDRAVMVLWEKDIYAEGGMGCTGPVVLVAENHLQKASGILQQAGYLAVE